MYQDYKDLLSAFQAHGVRYLIVGGYAVIFHAQPRGTKDMNLLIKADPANAQATYAALAEFGAPLQTSTRKILPTATAFSASAIRRTASIFFPTYPALILTRHGNGALKRRSIRTAG
jgi:hypothetical protein